MRRKTRRSIVVQDIFDRPEQFESCRNILNSVAHPIRAWNFRYDVPSHTSIWHSLTDLGDNLTEKLLDQGKQLSDGRPILFAAFGFGGIILKRALTTIYDRLDPLYRALSTAPKGLVFLGTPHPTYALETRSKKWDILPSIARIGREMSKKERESAANEVGVVANVCQQFGKTVTDALVMTVFESKSTKVKNGFWSRSTQIASDANIARRHIVDKTLAEIQLQFEECVEHHGNHSADFLCVGSDASTRMVTMIDSLANTSIATPTTSSTQGAGQAASLPPEMPQSVASDPGHHLKQAVAKPQPTPTPSPNTANKGSSDVSSYEMVASSSSSSMVQKLPLMPKYMFPKHDRNNHFTGRAEILKAIEKALITNHKAEEQGARGVRKYALCGLGGLGKTQIATEFVHLHKKDFDAIFWIQADETEKLDEDFSRIASLLGLIDQDEVKSKEENRLVHRNLVFQWLSSPRTAASPHIHGEAIPTSLTTRWLLVLDNADDLDILWDYWPLNTDGKGSVLLTSRDPEAKAEAFFGTTEAGRDVGPFTTKESLTLLEKLLNQKCPAKDVHKAETLAKRLAGLPLAVTQTASIIRRVKRATLSEFLDQVGVEPSIQELASVSDKLPQRDRYRYTLANVWSFGQQTTPELTSILAYVSFLDPDRIDDFLFASKNDDHARKIDYPHDNILSARATLLSSSLLTKQTSIVDGHSESYFMTHRLVQEVSQWKMDKDVLRNVFEFAVGQISANWPKKYDKFNPDHTTWKSSESIIRHIIKLEHHWRSNPGMSLQSAVAVQLAKVLYQGGMYLVERSSFPAARPLFDTALQMCKDHPADAGAEYIDALFSLCKYGVRTNMDPKSLLQYAQAHLDLCLQRGDDTVEKQEDLGMSHSNLGMAYLFNERYTEAEHHCLRSIEIDMATPDVRDDLGWPHFAYAYLGWALIGQQRYADALTQLGLTLAWRERKFGKDEKSSIKLAYTLHPLGIALQKLGREQEAQAAFQRALATYKGTSEDIYFRVGQVHVKIAQHCAHNKAILDALANFKAAIAAFTTSEHHKPELCRALFLLSHTYRTEKMDTDAEKALIEATTLHRELGHRMKEGTMPQPQELDALVRIWSR